MNELREKVALVTGASRGIGKAIALRLAQGGARVAVNNHDIETASLVADEINNTGGEAIPVCADVTDAQAVTKMVDFVLDMFGTLDILVNNAGVTRDQLLVRMTDDDWSRVLAINLTGSFLCTRAALRPMLKNRWGRIINISSVVGISGNAGQANYSASKAGMIGLMRSVSKEVASRGITVNAIAPGFIETDMTASLSYAQRQNISARIPAGNFGTAQDVAETVMFLASNAAHYITGQVICVDGGMGSI